MLKRRVDDKLWLTSQLDHAAVSGYLAAHWGNDQFTALGHYSPCPDPELLRAETVLAIAEHDNGWWEWEADPQLDPEDGLPLDLLGMKQPHGFERWRLGVPRFAEEHPYVALLISFHAYWLSAYRCEADLDPSFHHPLFGNPGSRAASVGQQLPEVRQFVAEQKGLQEGLLARLRQDPSWSMAVEPASLHPHVRLLQLADALSLALCFGGKDRLTLPGIPRRGWDDRVTLEVSPLGNGRLACRPYPFDVDPLPVVLRARVVETPVQRPAHFQTWWHSLERQQIRFEYCRGE